MLDDNLKAQLGAYLERVQQPFEITASLNDSESSRDTLSLLQTIAGLRSDKITLKTDGQDARKPSFDLKRVGSNTSLRFAGLPLGHEFTSLVLALLWTGGHPPKVEPEVIEQIQALDGDFNFEVYMSLTCHNCPDVVQALSLMAILNPKIKTTVIEGGTFQEEVTQREVMAVPMVFLNGQEFASGRMTVDEIVAKLDTGSAAREAVKLNAKDPYEVLIVGGGPAGAAAAVYAARKGIRTGIAAERLGGQVNDTMSIENYVSVLVTDGPKFAAALEAHAREYDVDIMNMQRADKIIPAEQPGGLISVQMANGAVLKSRTVILSTGARWRNVNVPGEQEYKNKGVAYCPHCDGPLYKGKRVAVIGGGNSGVEAQGRCRAGQQAQEPAQCRDPRECTDHRDHRCRGQGQWPELQGPGYGRKPPRVAGRRVRADRPGAQYRVAQGHGRAVALRRDHRRCQGRDQCAGRLWGR
jgi:NADH-dependent peroxiredoxin subunit F